MIVIHILTVEHSKGRLKFNFTENEVEKSVDIKTKKTGWTELELIEIAKEHLKTLEQ